MKSSIKYYLPGLQVTVLPALIFILIHLIFWKDFTNPELKQDLLIQFARFIPAFMLWQYQFSNRVRDDIDAKQVYPYAAIFTVLAFNLIDSPWYETLAACVVAVVVVALMNKYLLKDPAPVSAEIANLVPSESAKEKGNSKEFTWDEVIRVPKQKLTKEHIKMLTLGGAMIAAEIVMLTYSIYLENLGASITMGLCLLMSLGLVYFLKQDNFLQYDQTKEYIKNLGYQRCDQKDYHFPNMHGWPYVKDGEFYHILESDHHNVVSIRKLS